MDKKIVVCSCTEFGYEIVDFLLTNGVNISHLVSLSPEQAIQYKVSGYRSFELLSTKYGVPIYYPKLYSMKESDFDFFEKEKFDLLLVCGWQRLIPEKILGTIKICGIGSHGGSELLPKGRGLSLIHISEPTRQAEVS